MEYPTCQSCMTQDEFKGQETMMTKKQGLKIFENAGKTAVSTEPEQVHSSKVIKPNRPHELSSKERIDALRYLMLLKENHAGQIKVRGCSDGRKQQLYMQKEKTSLPTVAVESLIISATMDAHERWNTATAETPGAFMQADMVESFDVKLEGMLADLLTNLDPKLHKKYLTMRMVNQPFRWNSKKRFMVHSRLQCSFRITSPRL